MCPNIYIYLYKINVNEMDGNAGRTNKTNNKQQTRKDKISIYNKENKLIITYYIRINRSNTYLTVLH